MCCIQANHQSMQLLLMMTAKAQYWLLQEMTALSGCTAGSHLVFRIVSKKALCICHVKYQTRGKVFHRNIRTKRSELKNQVQPSFFLTNFEVFGFLMKHFLASQTDH